jgi:hypothetical protein
VPRKQWDRSPSAFYQNGELNPSISSTTWCSAVANTIAIVRNLLPNAKISVDASSDYAEDPYVNCVVGSVDLLEHDGYAVTGGASSEADWEGVGGKGAVPYCRNNPIAGCTDFPYISSYAAAHSKPLALGEFCDQWNDGCVTTQVLNWAAANNYVAMGYWDSDEGIGPGHRNLQVTNTTLSTLSSMIGSLSYTGSFWQPYKGVPPAITDDIGF